MGSASAAELLAGVARRDGTSWEVLVERYSGLIWSVARSQSLDASAAADVCQTVWLRLAENCERIRDPERLPAWLATTARHEAIRLSKAAWRQQPVDLVDQEIDLHAPPPGERIEESERLAEVLSAFRKLGEQCREMLRLLSAEPRLDYHTIATMTGRPVGSIGPTRARCLEQLRRLMGSPAKVEP